MKIKKFVAKDYKTALKKAKDEMGEDAIILQTQQVKKSSFWGIFSRPQVEITVALDDTLKVGSDRFRRNNYDINNTGGDIQIQEEATPLFMLEEIKKMYNLMAEIKTKMWEVEMIKGLSVPVQSLFEILLENNVDKELALQIAANVEQRLPNDKMSDKKWVKEVFLHTIKEFLLEISPLEKLNLDKKLVLFVGPTGVGKTTTIAKLASNMTFNEGKNVALITLDTYRISAADQLKTFADIIGIPISIVFTSQDMAKAIEEYGDKDVIFIDTAGRSPYNTQQMQELGQLVENIQPSESILVLSVTTESQDLVNIYRQFERFGITKVIFTKLDETLAYGQLLNALNSIKKPIAYLTNGQNVPDDISLPDYNFLADMLLRRN